jgi:hypothetical protein
MTKKFSHRSAFGVWINDMRNTKLRTDNWPCMIFDSVTMDGLKKCIDLLQKYGYNEFCLWGLLNSYSWSLDLQRESDENRLEKVREIIKYAADRGIGIIYGMGVYSWGCAEVIKNHPEVGGTDPNAMCGSSDLSFEWVKKYIDFVFSRLDVAGMHLESADLGRCRCSDCSAADDFTYHCGLNLKTAKYIREAWPGKIVMVNMISWQSWDRKIGRNDSGLIDKLADLGRHVDYIIDPGHLGQYMDDDAFTEASGRLECDLGTAGGFWVYYKPTWDRLGSFLPYTRLTYGHVGNMYDKGGRAIEYYMGPSINPAAEMNTAFTGILLNDAGRGYNDILEEAVASVYGLEDMTTIKQISDIFINAEDAWFYNWNGRISRRYKTDPFVSFDDFDKYFIKADARPGQMFFDGAQHLSEHMDPSHWPAYRRDLCRIAADAGRIREGYCDMPRVRRILEGITNTIMDLEELEDYEKWR